jgi:hypothetical protein
MTPHLHVLLQLGVAVAVILITYKKLSHISHFSVDASNHTYSATGTCLLDADTARPDACIYAYAVAGVSILATFLVSIFLVSISGIDLSH